MNDETFVKLVSRVQDYAVFLLDPKGNVATWNDGAERLKGYRVSDIVGQHFSRFYPQDAISEGWPGHVLREAETVGRVEDEGWRVRQDGSKFWANVVITALRDEEGELRGFLKITRDLTKRKQAEEERRQKDERFRLLIESVKDYAIFMLDPLGRVTSWNAGAERLKGYKAQEIVGEHFARFYPQEAVEQGWPEEELRRATEEGRYEDEGWRVRQDGSRFWANVIITPIRDQAGQLKGFAKVTRDLTDRKQAEDDLRLRDRAIGAVSQGIVIADAKQPNEPIIHAWAGFEKLTGYRAKEVLGKNCRFMQGRDTSPEAVAQVREAVRAGRECSVELMNYRKNGTPFWNHLSIYPVRDEDGTLTHFVGIQIDMTDWRRLEEQFRQAQKLEAIGRLAGGVAHDFNNLLTVINGYSQILLGMLHHHQAAANMLDQIHKAGERAAGLTHQLLAYSRKQMLQPEVLDINAVVEDARKMLMRIIGEDVELNWVPARDLCRVHADPGQLGQVLLNLCVNARDAMPTGGKITIETKNVELDESSLAVQVQVRSGQYVLLAVSDTGVGMDAETQSHLFEPFFTTKEAGKGTGLGLATVYGIVKQSGGYITVYSELGHGTTFKVYLPAVEAEMPAVECATEVPGGKETVLLVEDEESVRALARIMLQRSGYTVLSAASGDEALAVAGGHQGVIELLISDVVMRGMSGRQVAEALRLLNPSLKVLFVSGYTDDAVVRHGVLESETAFLQKPFTMNDFARKIREVLDERK